MPKKLHLKFQVIPTSFDPVSTLGGKSATESSTFPKNRKLCALICTAFQQVFFRGIKPINEEKCQRKIQEKTEAKKPEKRPRNGDRKATEKWTKVQGRRRPWVQGRRRPWKSGSPDFGRNVRFSDSFRVSRCLAPVIFLKSDF